VAVTLSHNDRELFGTEGSGSLRGAVLSVYGREVAESMIEIQYSVGDEEPVDSVRGLISHPETTRSTRSYLATFVNDRYVTASALRGAVVDGYGGQLAVDRYPFAVLFVEVPPAAVDVNVHPRKTEVRFDHEDRVMELISEAVERTLVDSGLIRSSAPRGRSAPEETQITPERGENTVEDEPTDDSSSHPESVDSDEREEVPEPTVAAESDADSSVDGEPSVDQPGDDGQSVGRGYSPMEPTTQQTLMGGETTEGRSYDRLPELRVLGQLYDTYLLAETESGLILIDQHAADERVNYERLQAAVADSPSTQRLAEPVSLELTAREAALFDDHGDKLAEVGFRADRRETRLLEVTAVPAVFSTTLDPELLREVLLNFVSSADDGSDTVTAVVDDLLADLACYPSITGNTSLTDGSVVDLLAALDDCENPYACPHGRPVIIEIGREEIDDRFERDYPGHGGRREE